MCSRHGVYAFGHGREDGRLRHINWSSLNAVFTAFKELCDAGGNLGCLGDLRFEACSQGRWGMQGRRSRAEGVV